MPKFIPPPKPTPYEKFVQWLKSKGWRPRWNGYNYSNTFFTGTIYGAIKIDGNHLYYQGISDNDALDIVWKLEEVVDKHPVEYERATLYTWGNW